MSNTPERDNTDQQLTSVCEALGIPESSAQTTRARLAQLRSHPQIENKPMAVVGAATLSLTSREDGLPITVPDIADAWSKTLEEGHIEPDRITSLFGVIIANLDIQGTPPQPRALIERYGEALGLPDGIIVVANRILVDLFTENPDMVAEGSSRDGTIGAILYLAAKINGYEDISGSDISDTLGTGQFTVENRSKKLHDMLGKDRLANSDRYHLNAETGAPKAPESAEREDAAGEQAAADGAAEPPEPADPEGDSPEDTQEAESVESSPESAQEDSDDEPVAGEPTDHEGAAQEATDHEEDAEDGESATTEDIDDVEKVVQSMFPDELPTTNHVAEELDVSADAATAALEQAETDGDIERKEAGSTVVWLPGERTSLTPDLTEDAVQNEVDDIVEMLDLSASLRVFARGLVSDAVDTLSVENADEMAGAAILAAARIQDIEVDAEDIADAGEFQARVLYSWIDKLAETLDVEVPRADTETFVEQIVEEMDLDDAVHDDITGVIEQHESRANDPEYTDPEVAAGATAVTATIGGAAIDADELETVSGADAEYITDAKSDILAGLCRQLVSGDIAYDDTAWTADLLASDVVGEFDDSETRATIALAQTYVAGRESEDVDEATIDELLDE